MKVFRAHILVCAGTACVSGGSWRLKDALEAELERRGLSDEVQVVTTGCNGFCVAGPIMIVYPEGIFYQKVTPEDVPILVEEHILKGRPVPRLFYKEPVTREAVPTMKDIVFFGHQVLRALRNRGLIDPDSIDEYIARDGYLAIHKALTEMTPEQIIKEMKASGLRGRGGGGFPTGLKWEFCAKAKGDIKYVLCNADEGDPGAFMDRSILEADPHAVLEGMMIAGRAIGSSQGYIYVRAEYPLAIQRLYLAIKQAKEYGLLGEGILGTDFSFDIDLYQGAGAFVCGEETALMFSIEGKRGNPRPRPPFPAQKGLWNKPSILNNVETFANVPQIILNGAQWFASLGTEGSKGTKVFSLSGAVNNIGLVEVPMGTTLETIIYDIGGGIIGERKFKAVQIGGPSGGFLPASLLKTPVDYESINATGAIMGSGGMVVADETTCMVDAARFFLEFTQDESCGKCPPCRIGTKVMLDILTRITEGRGQEGDIELLEDLAKNIKAASLCGLGQTAPNPVLTTIRYFRDEYEAHIKYKRCPAVACKAIISSPCQHACPIDQDAPAYIGLIMQRKFQKAWELITEKNPLPAICGRVCHHPCERVCRRGVVDEPVAIRLLKRFVDDYEAKHNGRLMASPPPQREDGRVAIIGSGPAGLTAAHFLAKDGFAVTIFEALPVAGGMLAVGIPEYRLPKDILNREIERIKSLGVEIKLNSPVGSDLTIEELFHQGYKAIFIAVGAHKGLQLRIPGEEAEGVMDCVSFLRDFNLGRPVKVGKKVGVIGGGNAAIDAARTALRLGAEEVSIIYRRTRVEMPADKTEVDEAEKEGIKIVLLAAPGKILTENGKVTGIECIRMELGDIDASGRRRPVPIKGSEFTIELDTLIPAISQEPDLSFLPQDHQFNISKWNTFVVDEETMATNVPGVFAGGDAVTGPDTVVMAMRAGKIAAESIGRYLRGKSLKREYHVTKPLWEVERTAFIDAEV
ncbi:MAG: NADH-quinone oxidoreductase subunit NuoF, partial [candidate division KSB1 bacterium]|nr:NADH-quinone oxidoreductase subunit NuoF [candidate division KSB1 bacterium]